MKRLPEDVAFIHRMQSALRDAGVMRDPVFDARTCQLVEAGLRIDLFNVWHTTHQLAHPDTSGIVDSWARPKHLGHACSFGRIDVVEHTLASGTALDANGYEGDPIAAAIEAWVVTPLHVQCVQSLYAAGMPATLAQFDAYSAESVGSEADRSVLTMLLHHARRSTDPAVRQRAEAWSPAP